MTRTRPTGWAVFAATILAIVGAVNCLYGLAGILNDDLLDTHGGGLLIASYTAWGWISLLFGIAQIAIAVNLYRASDTAAAFAVILAMLNAVTAIHLIAAYPLWAILIITLDVLVIFNLTVHGPEAEPRG